MAYTTNATTPTFLARTGNAFDALATRFKQYRLYRQTVEGLSGLSTRELNDLGIHRADIRRIAKECTRR